MAIGYVLILLRIKTIYDDKEQWTAPTNYFPLIKVSIVIAARNEAANIRQCITGILANDYSNNLIEIIIVDDDSDDDTAAIVQSFEGVIYHKMESNAGKKAALAKGISLASSELILCTDADCLVPSSWIKTIVSFYETRKVRFIAAPIKYITDRSIISRFQYIDNLNNMCVTGAGIYSGEYFLANGGNMAFEKSLFEEIGGFKSNENLASGDDVFMIQAAAKIDKSKIRYLKAQDATVSTFPEKSISNLLRQRKRWATKSKYYSEKGITYIQGYVFTFVLLIFTCLMTSVFGFGGAFFAAIFAIFIKFSIDYLYLYKLADEFENRKPMKSYLICAFLYLPYILLAGWWALTGKKYIWKGRQTQ